jgi:hypothetical protein
MRENETGPGTDEIWPGQAATPAGPPPSRLGPAPPIGSLHPDRSDEWGVARGGPPAASVAIVGDDWLARRMLNDPSRAPSARP